MLNPFGSQPVPGSYTDLQNRMYRHMQHLGVNNQIFEVVKNAYEQALSKENIILSRAERIRLLSQILKMVLDDMVRKLK